MNKNQLHDELESNNIEIKEKQTNDTKSQIKKGKNKIKYLAIGLIFLSSIIIAIVVCIKIGEKKIKIEANSNYDLYILLNEENISDIEILNSNLDISKLGEYELDLKITYSIGKEKNKKLKVEVIDTTKPVFSGNNNIMLMLGEDFNPLENIKASDNYDGDISDRITILSNTVNAGVVGEYKVVYSVVDSNGNQEVFSSIVNVVEKKYIGIKLAIEYLTEMLKNPDSLTIREVRYNDYQDSIANYDVVVIKYSAQNGFGGISVETSYIDVYLNEMYAATNIIGGIIGISGEKIEITSINKNLGTNY